MYPISEIIITTLRHDMISRRPCQSNPVIFWVYIFIPKKIMYLSRSFIILMWFRSVITPLSLYFTVGVLFEHFQHEDFKSNHKTFSIWHLECRYLDFQIRVKRMWTKRYNYILEHKYIYLLYIWPFIIKNILRSTYFTCLPHK